MIFDFVYAVGGLNRYYTYQNLKRIPSSSVLLFALQFQSIFGT